MARILAYTSPAPGHAFPLVPGLLALRDRGHDIHLRTDPKLVDTLRAAGLEADGVDPRSAAIKVTDYEARGLGRLSRGLHDLMERGPFERAQLEADIAARRPDLLLVDLNSWGGAVAAERSGLPWAMTVPTLLPLPGRGIPPFGLGLKPRPGALGRARDALATRFVLRMYGKAMLPGVNAMRAQAGLPAFSSALDPMLAPDRLILLTGAPLEYPRSDLPGHVRIAGAQLWDPPAETPAWLEEPGDPWVLVTCSTDYQGDEKLAAAAIEALRDEPVRVLVTLADAAQGAAALPTARNARVERFVPHGPVLERAAAVVCHGGMGIVQKTIGAGVPLVVVPFGRDHPEVARRVREAGAGVALSPRRLAPARLRAAVRAAIAMKPAVEAAGRRLGDDNAARVADAVEELAARPAAVAARA